MATRERLEAKLTQQLLLADRLSILAGRVAEGGTNKLNGGPPALELRDRVLIGLAFKLLNSFHALVDDARKKRPESFHHLKTMVEIYIYFHWVESEAGETRSKLLLAKGEEEKVKFLKNNRDDFPESGLIDERSKTIGELTVGLEKEWQDFRRPGILQKLARSVSDNLLEWYNRGYRPACEPAHMGDLSEYMPLPRGPIEIPTSTIPLLRTLIAMDYVLMLLSNLLSALDIMYELGFEEEIAATKATADTTRKMSTEAAGEAERSVG